MPKIFEERVPFKPFEYPIYFNEGWMPQQQAHWLINSFSSSYKTQSARNSLVINLLRGFISGKKVANLAQKC